MEAYSIAIINLEKIIRGAAYNRPNNMAAIIAVDLNTPDINRNCRVEFIVPVTQSYTVRLVNLGPGVANSCQVTIEER